MAQYNITVDDEILKGLFIGVKGMSQLFGTSPESGAQCTSF